MDLRQVDVRSVVSSIDNWTDGNRGSIVVDMLGRGDRVMFVVGGTYIDGTHVCAVEQGGLSNGSDAVEIDAAEYVTEDRTITASGELPKKVYAHVSKRYVRLRVTTTGATVGFAGHIAVVQMPKSESEPQP